ncbi:MAG: flagellar export protein FliJ [Thermovenabulum sp.]|uniref:flagellar export protein FliJ n=1 Tax=Thermovenabulum sp. TaxID=3100335 RepID=UPI003C7A39B8
MKKFSFKLEQLLKVKEGMENLKKEELFKVKARLEEEKNILEGLETKKREILNQKYERETDFVKAVEFIYFDNYYRKISEMIGIQRQKVNEAQKEYEDCLNNYLEAKKEKRTLEILKERKFRTFLEEYNREEQKNLDEHGLIAFSRRDELN